MEPGASGSKVVHTEIGTVTVDSAPSMGADTRRTRLYLSTVVLVVLTYNCLFFNRYLPITEGWFSVYAAQINEGRVPYRDFYLLLPPAYPILISAFTAVFGYSFIALRVAGVILMCVFSATLFGLLRVCFAEWVAASVTIAMTVYYQGSNTHISYDFVQVLTTSVLLSTYCLLRYARTRENGGKMTLRSLGWVLAAGALCGWAGMTKQSNGGVVTLFCALGAAVAGAQESWRKAMHGFIGFSIGVASVIAAFVLWLAWAGALGDFIDQVIVGAAAAKGSPGIIFFAFLGHFFGHVLWTQLVYLSRFFVPSLFWGLFIFCGFRRWWALDSFRTDRIMPVIIIGFSFLAILLPLFLPEFVRDVTPLGLVPLRNYVIPCGFVGMLFLGIVILATAVLRREKPNILLVLVLTALGLIWGNGTSAGLSETGVFLGLALFLAVLLSHAGWFTPVAVCTAGLIWLQMATWSDVKFTQPYEWWGIKESGIRGPLVPAPDRLQQGIWVGSETAEVYKRVTTIIQRESKPGDRILVFPNTPVFYLICDRRIMGRAVVDWFDFLPDDLAIKEAAILANDPPALIVWLEIPETVWAAHERLFRGGRPCGQRAIRQAYEDLRTAGRIREVAQVPVSKGFIFHFSRLEP